MSSVGEEFGFVGICVVLLLFAGLIWRGIVAALSARDSFGSYLAFGLTLGFAYQALINTGVVLGLLPAKGLTLPFVSYGGSSLMMSMFFAGLLLSIGQSQPHRKRKSELVNSVGGVRRKQRVVVVVE
jgi:cell division protein FtsW